MDIRIRKKPIHPHLIEDGVFLAIMINKIQHCLRCGQALAYGEFIGREPQYRTLEEEIEAIDKINEGCVNSLTGGEKYMSLAKERELILLKYPYQEG